MKNNKQEDSKMKVEKVDVIDYYGTWFHRYYEKDKKVEGSNLLSSPYLRGESKPYWVEEIQEIEKYSGFQEFHKFNESKEIRMRAIKMLGINTNDKKNIFYDVSKIAYDTFGWDLSSLNHVNKEIVLLGMEKLDKNNVIIKKENVIKYNNIKNKKKLYSNNDYIRLNAYRELGKHNKEIWNIALNDPYYEIRILAYEKLGYTKSAKEDPNEFIRFNYYKQMGVDEDAKNDTSFIVQKLYYDENGYDKTAFESKHYEIRLIAFQKNGFTKKSIYDDNCEISEMSKFYFIKKNADKINELR